MGADTLDTLLERLRRLPPRHQAEVADFVDFLIVKGSKDDVALITRASEAVFGRIWDNDEDAAYDAL